MTPDSKDILDKLRALTPILPQWHIKRLRVFGSVARGTAGPDSDVDLIADFDVLPGLTFFTIEKELERRLLRRVDLFTEGALKPMIKSSILSEARDVIE
jgi:predicted nucleotidyltransferase